MMINKRFYGNARNRTGGQGMSEEAATQAAPIDPVWTITEWYDSDIAVPHEIKARGRFKENEVVYLVWHTEDKYWSVKNCGKYGVYNSRQTTSRDMAIQWFAERAGI